MKPLCLTDDVETRWDSVLMMCEKFTVMWDSVICELARSGALDQFIEPGLAITEEMIQQVKAMCSVLRHFASVTRLAGSKDFPTLSQVPHWLCKLRQHLEIDRAVDGEFVSQFKKLAIKSFDERTHEMLQTPSLALMCAALDPSQFSLPVTKPLG